MTLDPNGWRFRKDQISWRIQTQKEIQKHNNNKIKKCKNHEIETKNDKNEDKNLQEIINDRILPKIYEHFYICIEIVKNRKQQTTLVVFFV